MTYKRPDEYEDFQQFFAFVSSELGDVPVLDEGNFISPKITFYWAAWRTESDVYVLNETDRWLAMLKARTYWVRYNQIVHQQGDK